MCIGLAARICIEEIIIAEFRCGLYFDNPNIIGKDTKCTETLRHIVRNFQIELNTYFSKIKS